MKVDVRRTTAETSTETVDLEFPLYFRCLDVNEYASTEKFCVIYKSGNVLTLEERLQFRGNAKTNCLEISKIDISTEISQYIFSGYWMKCDEIAMSETLTTFTDKVKAIIKA